MSTYNTEQKKLLTEYLLKRKEEAFSAEDIAKGMEAEYGEAAPGKSTVYRLLPKLCDEGRVKRFLNGSRNGVFYQIVDGSHCRSHLHMKCLSCGKLLHMSNAISDDIFDKVHDASDFCIDRENTVLFGLCSACGHKVAP